MVLAAAAVFPGHATSQATRSCLVRHCRAPWTVRWTRVLPGSWLAADGPQGTVLRRGAAYAAVGSGIAAIGFGDTVAGYDERTGTRLWTAAPLLGFALGAMIVSVRAWPGAVTVGVAAPAAAGRPAQRDEVVLSARTGKLIRVYPAAEFGGAVAADAARTVVVGPHAVICYRNATGRPVWSRATGRAAQAWRVDGGELYVTVAADGYLGTAPVTALRRIDLKTGVQRVIRPARGPFAGTLSGAVAGVTLFSAAGGLTAYDGRTGRLLWHRADVVPDTFDPVRRTLYVTHADALIGISPATGGAIKNLRVRGSSALYAVRSGVALGLDPGALGAAWGYDLASHRVIWTSRPLPWPHYFADLSGLGGSSDPATGTVLLTACAAGGAPLPSGTAQACGKPELVALASQ